MSAARILVVEDDEIIRAAVTHGLRLDGFEVREARTLGEARGSLAGEVDLVLLDVGLPDGNGLELLRDMRASGWNAPVLVLTARGSEEDRVLGFEYGCDDYVVKPFSLKELRLRITALLRRARAGAVAGAPAGRARVGGVEVDFQGHRVLREGCDDERLSPKERDMLRLFLDRPGQVISRDEFLREVWGYQRSPVTRTVDMHVRKLREKLEPDPDQPRHFVTVHGAGYRYDP